MLFNSIDFALFLPIVFLIYWFVAHKNLKFQNILLLIASYFFYGWWDWRFLLLIALSTIIDYYAGLKISKEHNAFKRKLFLGVSLFFNLGILGFFKYYNFFLDNFISAFSFFGTEIHARTLTIVLPIGISFYTFQTLSYTIDVYNKKLAPTTDFIAFAAFISFFPQLVAGPIERATNLLPQFYNNRIFVYKKAVDGLRQILWGLFKKIVIADTCAEFANQIFNNSENLNGSTLALGAVFFAFQIYGDFSGYSDIAIGTSRLFGFNLMQNFNFPYFSRTIGQFWRRWHISLSSWFRDYVYIPLGGNKKSKAITIRNICIVFIVSGFWHGANWTFIAWGALNAMFYLPLLLAKNKRKKLNPVSKDDDKLTFKSLFQMLFTFSLTVLGWIFFRAETIQQAFSYISEIFSASFFSMIHIPYKSNLYVLQTLLLIVLFMSIEWFGRTGKYAIEDLPFRWRHRKICRWGFYMLIGLTLFVFGNFNKTEFIYFAF